MLPIVLTVVVAVAGIVAVGGYFLTRDTQVAQVSLEPVAYSGQNPFTQPVGTDETGVKTPVGTGGAFPGDTPGLYGEDGGAPSCDVALLTSALAADSGRATAWAEALGLTAADIPAYLPTLSAVVLRADTVVTEHNFVAGTFNPYPAVLQAGTAVLVNPYGEPKVKCQNGNPLTRPATTGQKVAYTGSPWTGFTPVHVTVVTRPPAVVKTYVFVDIRTGGQKTYPGKNPGPDDGRGYCDRQPDSDKCRPTTVPPNSPIGPSPGKGCTAADGAWVCPVMLDPAKKPAANCVEAGNMWSCPVVDPNTPPATGCTKAGPSWSCPPPLDPTTPPAPNCTVAAGSWSCPFPTNPDTLPGINGKCTKMVVSSAQGSTFSQSCPQPFNVDAPPRPECNSAGEGSDITWECPVTDPTKPPAPGCQLSGGTWVKCGQPFNPASPPVPGCLAQGFMWVCPAGN
ncbi:DUF6777 domain-containing protein, partial [Pseudonocardia sp.]|uniref:DUF6777 domain-containing protein n=1 Tax=Pseudonocardia sp. TaxID=60912 RepID=UPI003D0F4641